jgi:hypothetical protein
MKLVRSIIIPAIAAVSFLAAPAALTATSAAQAAPVAATAHYSPDTQISIHWVYYGPYPTLHACNVEGDYLYFHYNVSVFRCIPASGGEYIYYQLWLGYAG